MSLASQICIKEAEQAFFDAYYRQHAPADYPDTLADFCERFRRVELVPFHEGGWSWWADPHQEVFDKIEPVNGLRVLDYGCGSGKLGTYLAHRGADVNGFDLSGEATAVANHSAARYGLSAEFRQMDAENLTYPDNEFDLALGFGVLHHVIKYPRASSELFRVMKPGARAVFVETLWDNPVLNLARRATLAEEDAGDAHLTDRNIREFCHNFSDLRLDKRHLLYMSKRLGKLPKPDLSIPLRPRAFWHFVKALDDTLLHFTPLRRYCGEVIVWMGKSQN
jgi:2-polyprenyl-3-methyl-5-hydroxy-6-metoxy-1,4-benzoquinol methylase